MRFLVILALTSLAGCGLLSPAHDRCDKQPPYVNSPEARPLVIPEGVDAPDTRSALRVPDLTTPEKPLDGRCVDAPPSYVPAQAPDKG